MFKSINREINQIINRGFDRTLRLAVTGLSRSGKTAFITSLINQLLHINQEGNAHLPLFEAARNQSILAVKRVPQQDLSIPRFDYEANLNDLMNNPPQWCQSTRGVSETRLAIRFERQSGLLRHFKERGTLYLDIFDYPGEWLLDLPLLNLDFQQWSLEQAKITSGIRQQFAQDWLDKLKKLDLSVVVNEDVLAQIAKSYTDYLLACKAEGMQFIQPGRFVLPGELEGAPVLQFFPLLHLSEEQWLKLKKEAKSNSYFAVLNKRYDYYRNKVVKGFYENYFSTFDRQVILADCLTPLNHSQQAFIDMQTGLNQLFKNFHYGKRNLLNRLFSPNIDKLMFVATKADHITTDQIQNLISLMRQLVQEGGRHVEFEGIDTEYTAIAAIRATKQVLVNQNGKLPSAEFWSKQSFDFDSFEPQVLQQGESIPHLRMDAVLQFLLADRFD